MGERWCLFSVICCDRLQAYFCFIRAELGWADKYTLWINKVLLSSS